MYKCDICGREIFKKIRMNGHTLCSKHKHQILKYGHPLDNNPRTVNDLNDYTIDYELGCVYFNVYNQKCSKVGFFAVDLCDIELVKYHKWRFNSFGHVVTGSGAGNIRDLSHIILGIPKELDSATIVDHKDGDPTNNRRYNLRVRTQQDNLLNKNFMSTNTTGIIGVSYDKTRNVYAPEIRYRNKRLHLGRYKSIEEAAYVRFVAEQLLFKEFANEYNVEKKKSIAVNLSFERQEQLYNYTVSKLQANFGNQLR